MWYLKSGVKIGVITFLFLLLFTLITSERHGFDLLQMLIALIFFATIPNILFLLFISVINKDFKIYCSFPWIFVEIALLVLSNFLIRFIIHIIPEQIKFETTADTNRIHNYFSFPFVELYIFIILFFNLWGIKKYIFVQNHCEMTKIYFLALFAVITTCFAQCSSNVSNCNKIIDFKKLNGDYFSEIEIKPNTPISFSTNNYLIFSDNRDLGTLFYNDTSINLSNFLYHNHRLDSGINLSPLALHKISLGERNTYYLITYNIDNFIGTNGEMLGILIRPKEKILSKIIYIPLSDIFTIGDADKNEKLDILTFNNGEDNFLNKDSMYTIFLSEFDSKGNLQIRNKGHVLFAEPDLLIDSCKFSFLRN